MGALNPSAQAPESDLVQRAGGGDKEAFYLLVQPCEKLLFAAAMAILKNPEDAEEAAQEAVLKAFLNIGRFRGESKFSTWITQICVNEARQKIRKAHKYMYDSIDEPECGEEGDYFPRDFADWREIPSEALERKELQVALRRALDCLPEKYREILILRDIQNLSIEEAAQVLGLSPANVKTRLLRARLQMRDALAPGLDGSWAVGREEYVKVRAW
jgi:RNA polymerase sigma-70 factor (ECF subfamily)